MTTWKMRSLTFEIKWGQTTSNKKVLTISEKCFYNVIKLNNRIEKKLIQTILGR